MISYKPELLSPAGSMEALTAAVQNGADAVYLGGKRFNARQYASNFDDEELNEAVKYVHLRGRKIYVTLNTIVFDKELDGALQYITFLHKTGVDAVIVQDIGIASIIGTVFPDLPVHASTQMNVHDLNGVRLLEDMGISRVILARELTMEEIAGINRQSGIELEVFVQGALCMCYSGQCLMSSIIGGRSGNRGRCAQPCRLRYSIVDREKEDRVYREGYLLSPRDLFTLDSIGRLIDARISSFKIEGRMKRPEYVAAVTSVYRKAIDEYLRFGRVDDVEEGRRKIGGVFYRGFTKGYMFDACEEEMLSVDRPDNRGLPLGRVVDLDSTNGTVDVLLGETLSPGDGIEFEGAGKNKGTSVSFISVKGEYRDKAFPGEIVTLPFKGRPRKGDKVNKTYDKELMENLTAGYTKDNVRVPVNMAARFRIGLPVELYVWDEHGNTVHRKSSKSVEEAVSLPLNEARIREQLSRTGGTPYSAAGMEIDLEENAYIPLSELNALRREALDELSEKRTAVNREEKHIETEKVVKDMKGKRINMSGGRGIPYLAVETGETDLIEYIEDFGVDRIHLRYSPDLMDKLEKVGGKARLYIKLPLIVRRKDTDEIMDLLKKYGESIAGVEVSNPGQINMIHTFADNIKIHGGATLNVSNSISIKKLLEWGLTGITLSPEINLAQMRDLARYYGPVCETIVHGRLRLMTIEYPLLKGLQKGIRYGLKDRKNMVFPIGLDGTKRVEILNSQPLFMLDKMDEITGSGIGGVRMVHSCEEPGDFSQMVENYKRVIMDGEYDAGLAEDMVREGMTRGHFYRGVD